MPPPRKESTTKKIAAYLKLAADVGGIIMDLRDRPSRADWFSLALRSANVGLSWFSERRRISTEMSPWDYFTSERGWHHVPSEYSKIVTTHARDLQIANEYVDADVKLPYCVLAKIDGEVVGWSIENGQIMDGPYYLTERKTQTFEAVGRTLWRTLGGKHLLYTPSGLVLDVLNDANIIPTKQMSDLLDRVYKFMRAGEPRGYLLGGAPGTGKSVAIRWLTGALGMTSVRVDLRLLSDNGSTVTNLETMLRALRPDVMILDDLDRIEVNASMLAMLERARSTCRVVVASANAVSELSGAASRPGRLDDIIRFDKLDLAVVTRILGEYADLTNRVADLPAAYVAEFASRCRVLGRDQALADLDELRQRAEETSADGD